MRPPRHRQALAPPANASPRAPCPPVQKQGRWLKLQRQSPKRVAAASGPGASGPSCQQRLWEQSPRCWWPKPHGAPNQAPATAAKKPSRRQCPKSPKADRRGCLAAAATAAGASPPIANAPSFVDPRPTVGALSGSAQLRQRADGLGPLDAEPAQRGAAGAAALLPVAAAHPLAGASPELTPQ